MSCLTAFDFGSLSSSAVEFQSPNPSLLEPHLNDLFSYIWARDDYTYEHPRYRLQAALSILLVFYLGLHPASNLKEGFRYQNTKILLTKHNGILRGMLIICLEDQEEPSRTRLAGRTMILLDEPYRRYMCPVTLFLSLAVADGLFEGVKHADEISAMEIPEWPDWGLLRYSSGADRLAVMRRTSPAKGRIICAEIKSRVQRRIMLSQIERAGHEETFNKMMDDNRKATRRCRRVESAYVRGAVQSDFMLPLIIGRGQREMALTLLATHLTEQSNVSSIASLHAPCLKCPNIFPLPSLVNAQLTYDTTRRNIIAHLYEHPQLYLQMEEILPSFVRAAAPVAYEPYYVDATPDDSGKCPWCGAYVTGSSGKVHLLRCCRQHKMAAAQAMFTDMFYKCDWHCRWGSCKAHFRAEFKDADSAANHMSTHLSTKLLQCQWDSCGRLMQDMIALHMHLDADHQVYTQVTIPTRAKFCYECNLWMTNDLDWAMHGLQHAKNPHIVYGAVTAERIQMTGRRCPYCMKHGVYTQLENDARYLEHLNDHIDEEMQNSTKLRCPHTACEASDLNPRTLKAHFEKIHHIPFSKA